MKWYRWGCAKWEDNIIEYNENNNSIEERAKDYVTVQERNSVDTLDENTSDYKTDEKVNGQPEQGGGESTCECGIAYCAAGHILGYDHKWRLAEEAKNKPILDDQMEQRYHHSAKRNGTKV
jgi:hypothetical protein